MGFIKEFKDFAVKGNAIDLAVGVIVGGAFGKIVSSLVVDIIMPPLGLLIGGVNFSHLSITLKAGSATTPPLLLNYGLFIQNVFDFLIIAVIIFLTVKAITFLKKEKPVATPAAPTRTEQLLEEIRNELKKKTTTP